ncbi:MAG: aminotransferase class I/II-fold pyridoxal phosphate-dependent enzyme [Lachnospiraceae bacterium]|nr:aminotransferase class I/II-fold pyridoxal phosphate-dependent enzyme [Lachnospiraceae bacterium]
MKRYITENLINYLNETHIAWHMPGHKRKRVSSKPSETKISKDCMDMEFMDSTLDMLHTFDVTEIPGLDDLHNPNGVIKKSQEELAKVYKTYASYYLINGSTSGIMAAVAALCERDDKIIAAENCHKSVHNIISILGLKSAFVKPKRDIYGVSPDSVEKCCMENPDAKAVIITSPTYEGFVSDVRAISEIVKKYEMKLIVDEAHGAHLPFISRQTDIFPFSAIHEGADIVIQSLHKTMCCMTQTAIIHVMDEKIDTRVRKFLSVFMSSSPSYIMLCDMEKAIFLADKRDYTDYIWQLVKFRKNSNDRLNKLNLLDKINIPNGQKAYYDISRIVICSGKAMTGPQLERLLADEFKIVCEMSGPDYVVLISTAADVEKDFDYLYNALSRIDDNYDFYVKKISDIEIQTNQVYTFNTLNSDREHISFLTEKLNALEGAAAKDNIYVYPPGIYIVKKGEIYTRDKLDKLIDYVKMGKQLYGDLN